MSFRYSPRVRGFGVSKLILLILLAVAIGLGFYLAVTSADGVSPTLAGLLAAGVGVGVAIYANLRNRSGRRDR